MNKARSKLLIIFRVTSPLLLIGLTMSVGGCLYISTKGKGKTMKLFGQYELSTLLIFSQTVTYHLHYYYVTMNCIFLSDKS